VGAGLRWASACASLARRLLAPCGELAKRTRFFCLPTESFATGEAQLNVSTRTPRRPDVRCQRSCRWFGDGERTPGERAAPRRRLRYLIDDVGATGLESADIAMAAPSDMPPRGNLLPKPSNSFHVNAANASKVAKPKATAAAYLEKRRTAAARRAEKSEKAARDRAAAGFPP